MYIFYNLAYSIAKIIPFTIRSKQNLTFLQKYKKKQARNHYRFQACYIAKG